MFLPPGCVLNHPGSNMQNSLSPTGSRIISLEAKITWSLYPSHTSDIVPPISPFIPVVLTIRGGGAKIESSRSAEPISRGKGDHKDCHPHSSRTFKRSGIALSLCELASRESVDFLQVPLCVSPEPPPTYYCCPPLCTPPPR